MAAGYEQLTGFLKELDQLLQREVDLYIIGGAAITLAYDRKNRTADIDIVEVPTDIMSLGKKTLHLQENMEFIFLYWKRST